MASVRLHPEAQEEAEAAADWYEQNQAGLGSDFLLELARSIEVISESPNPWPVWPGVREATGIRRYLLTRFPYGIAYFPSQREIVVVAIAHLSRRPAYWIGRLGKDLGEAEFR